MGEGVTLAETATDEKQTSIVLNTKGLKETRTMSQQSIYKEVRITEKNQTNFGARKYVNWNENFTGQFNSRFEPAERRIREPDEWRGQLKLPD